MKNHPSLGNVSHPNRQILGHCINDVTDVMLRRFLQKKIQETPPQTQFLKPGSNFLYKKVKKYKGVNTGCSSVKVIVN